MNLKKIISDIFEDVSTIDDVISTDIDKFDNPLYMVRLRETMLKHRFPTEVVDELINTLMEGKYQALNIKSKKRVDFNSEEAMANAIKAGTHKEIDGGGEKEDGKEEPEEDSKEKSTSQDFSNEPHTGDVAHDLKVDADKEKKKKKLKKMQSEKPKAEPIKHKISLGSRKKSKKVTEGVGKKIAELEIELKNLPGEYEKVTKKGEIDRLNVLKDNWEKFTNAETEQDRVDAVQELVDNKLIARNSKGNSKRKIYITSMASGLDYKHMMDGGDGDTLTQIMSDIVDANGMVVDMRSSSADRELAKVSGDHNEAGVVALLDPSDENNRMYNEIRTKYIELGSSDEIAHKQNKSGAETINQYASKMNPSCDIDRVEAMGHLGKKEIKDKYDIDTKKNPSDLFVFCKSGKRLGISAKIYSNPRNITMKNSGTKTAGNYYLGNSSIDNRLGSLKEKHNIGNKPTREQKVEFKNEYLKLWLDAMGELSKTDEGQQKLVNMWNEVHGCGEDVATLITNKKTGEVKLHEPDHYCNPEPPLRVKFNGKKISVNFGAEDGEELTEMVCKTEKNGSVKLLFIHNSRVNK
ncbi:MAG: hypothetical protein H8D94_01395 [Candidatus Pelagibacter sp.]|nr:hypothetical protein [Candidatus Pelagibacter sp.]